jgi:hypothetical protein
VLENGVLRKIFGLKRDKVTGEWRKLHNEDLNELYSTPNIISVIKSRRMGLAGHVACMGERRGAYMVLVGIPEGKRPFGRPIQRWEHDIQLNVQKVGWRLCSGLIWLRTGTGGGPL